MIAMFDSGLGGLSVWRAVVAALPDVPVTYLADQAYMPYGSRSEAEITQRSLAIGRYLEAQGASLLVVACNTATAVAVSALRATLKIPVIGIEPAIKPAAAASRSRRIGVLATPATLASPRIHQLVERHAQGVDVIFQPGLGWVELVEEGDVDSPAAREKVAATLLPLLQEGVDQIVLGCTHYPFLAPLIRELAGEQIVLGDPAAAIARRVQTLLPEQPRSGAQYRFLSTATDTARMRARLAAIIGEAYPVQHITV